MDCATSQTVDAIFGMVEDNEIALATTVEECVIDGGDGDDAIYALAKQSTIIGGAGDDLMYVEGQNNEVFGNDGDDEMYLNGSHNRLNAGNGNNYIDSEGDYNILSANDGNNTFKSYGDHNSIIAFNGNNEIISEGDVNDIFVGDGENDIYAFGDNTSISMGHGNNELGVVGNNLDLDFGNGDNIIGLWGNGANINGGNGSNIIETLDKANANGRFMELQEYWMSDLTTTTTTTEKLINSTQGSSTTDTQGFWDALSGVLTTEELNIAKSVDMSQTVNGVPRYIVAQAADGAYHIYQKCSNTERYKAMVSVPDGSNYATVSETQTVNGSKIITINDEYEISKVTTYHINGVNNFNVNLGDGNNNVDVTSNDGNVNGNFGHGDNRINVDHKYTKSDDAIVTYETRTSQTTQEIGMGTLAGVSTNSPLIIDFNKDGKVSAMAGKGVDIDNDGTADGAAVDGDKMLAMSDINGNGKIDGAEVFGNKTVDPFTGNALNAANGFEALKLVAESAEKATGMKCYTNGEVDLEALKKALGTVGINLGFISDDNVSELEALSKVKAINVDSYKEQQETGAVQHNQLGSATFDDGSTVAVHDVWFQSNAITSYNQYMIWKNRKKA